MKSAQEIPCKARHILGSRKVKAVELRRSGMTYKQVGEALGVGPCRASQIVANSEWRIEVIEEGKDKDEEKKKPKEPVFFNFPKCKIKFYVSAN